VILIYSISLYRAYRARLTVLGSFSLHSATKLLEILAHCYGQTWERVVVEGYCTLSCKSSARFNMFQPDLL
jgi:hypothetical protein